jgi:hypothetical protein
MLDGEIFIKGFLTFYHRQAECITPVSPATVVQANIRVVQVFQLYMQGSYESRHGSRRKWFAPAGLRYIPWLGPRHPVDNLKPGIEIGP